MQEGEVSKGGNTELSALVQSEAVGRSRERDVRAGDAARGERGVCDVADPARPWGGMRIPLQGHLTHSPKGKGEPEGPRSCICSSHFFMSMGCFFGIIADEIMGKSKLSKATSLHHHSLDAQSSGRQRVV